MSDPQRPPGPCVGDLRKAMEGLDDAVPLRPAWTDPPGDDSAPRVRIDDVWEASDGKGPFLAIGVSLVYEGDE